ncbi:hypothetical protein EI94DRAFT_767066 [Lactarius quietus]|nr:hypothetical protein EI94DRAFT_767066 [Lactarius quietus]
MLVRESPVQFSVVPSGAEIIYYSASDPNDCTTAQKDKIYVRFWRAVLGLDGTTEVTRTLHFGAFIRVLQGHIAIDTAIFRNGKSGMQLVPWRMVGTLTRLSVCSVHHVSLPF